jgi:beta-lactamase regulating signal transducer with metallopeptidase domain
MSGLEALGSAPLLRAIGLALVHFVWQGLLIGALLAALLASLRTRSPAHRYVACLGGMLALLAAPLVTTWLVLEGVSNPFDRVSLGLPSFVAPTAVAHWAHPVLPWITGLWMLGVSTLQVRLIVGWLGARRMRRVGIAPVPEVWRREIECLAARLDVSRPVRIVRSSLVTIPSLIGWAAPVILIPARLATRLTPAQIRSVLAHELAHVIRHDYLVNVLQCVFESLLFFHPVTWWVSGRLRTEREYCCDDIALSVCDGPLEYARALSSLDELRDREARPALAATGGVLMRRIARIFDRRRAAPMAPVTWIPAIAGVAGVFVTLALFGSGCLERPGEAATESNALIGPAPVEAMTPADQQTLLALAVEKIEAARDSGQIEPALAARILEKVRAGNVLVGDPSGCCPGDGPPEGCISIGVVCGPEGPDGAGAGMPDCCPDGGAVDCSDLPEDCDVVVAVQTAESGPGT